MAVTYQQNFSHWRGPAKLSAPRLCSSDPRSLISLLNAAKEQPARSAIAAEIPAFGRMTITPKQRKRWLILAVPGLQITSMYFR
jgi:hypothetical protein